jgi:hypothetical protein
MRTFKKKENKMKTFSEYIVENTEVNEGKLKDLYKKAKRFLTGEDKVEFIAPLYEGDKPFNAEKKYSLFIDWEESVVYYDSKAGKWDSTSINSKLEEFAIITAKSDEKVKIVEQDDNTKYYGFIIGVGYKDDVDEFLKKELNNRRYGYTDWDY